MQQQQIRKVIAGEVRAHLGREQISKAELARTASISTTSIHRKLKGDVSFTVEELLRVEKALGLEYGSLMTAVTEAA